MFSLLRNLIYGNGVQVYQVVFYFLAALITVFIAMPIHECAHAFAAVKMGDPTPRYRGRLRLNPLAHIDYVGALGILLFGIGWAKPVPVDSRNFKNPKKGMALTALAGPVSNILLAFVCYFLFRLLPQQGTVFMYIGVFLMYVVSINVSLAVFNLLPIPPLDGSRLLTAFLSDRTYYRFMQYERYFIPAIFVLLFLGVLDVPLYFIRSAIYRLFDLLTFFL